VQVGEGVFVGAPGGRFIHDRNAWLAALVDILSFGVERELIDRDLETRGQVDAVHGDESDDERVVLLRKLRSARRPVYLDHDSHQQLVLFREVYNILAQIPEVSSEDTGGKVLRFLQQTTEHLVVVGCVWSLLLDVK